MTNFEPGSAEQQLEQKLAGIIRELDELCLMATNAETIDLVEGQKQLIGGMLNRSGTLAGLLLARRPQPFRNYHAA